MLENPKISPQVTASAVERSLLETRQQEIVDTEDEAQ